MVSGKRWQWQAVAVANVAKWQSDTVVSGGERVDGWQCVASGTVAVADVAVAIAGGVAVTKGGSGSWQRVAVARTPATETAVAAAMACGLISDFFFFFFCVFVGEKKIKW
jgi:hypothetical protein